jgi:hypothetical protein
MKIIDKDPNYLFASIYDYVLEEMGGILDILKLNEEVVCLLKDWKVYYFDTNHFTINNTAEKSLDRKKEIITNNQIIFQDLDSYYDWVSNGKPKQSFVQNLPENKKIRWTDDYGRSVYDYNQLFNNTNCYNNYFNEIDPPF